MVPRLFYCHAHTRFLIQLSDLLEKSVLLDELGIMLGADIQKDDGMKEPVTRLIEALLEFKISIHHGDYGSTLFYEQDMQALDTQRKQNNVVVYNKQSIMDLKTTVFSRGQIVISKFMQHSALVYIKC